MCRYGANPASVTGLADRTAYLTTSEAAEYLHLSKQFLEIARHRGDGPPYIKLARAVRYFKQTGGCYLLLGRFPLASQGP